MTTTKPKKTVRFNESTEEQRVVHGLHDHLKDVYVAKEALLNFLQLKIGDVILTPGKHMPTRGKRSPQSPLNSELATNIYLKTLDKIFHPHKAPKDLVESISKYLSKHMNQPIHEVIKRASDNPDDRTAVYTAVLMIRIGLKTFIDYNQCTNKCFAMLQDKTGSKDFPVCITHDGKKHFELLIECLHAHNEVEKALGVNNIAKFDELLRFASNNKCSMTRPQHVPQYSLKHNGGGVASSNKLHTGPRGGKYIIVNNKKKYI